MSDPQFIGYSGNYATWEDAVADSTGYDTDIILQRTRDAILRVKRGDAPYERDSVVFDKPEHPFPLIAALLRIATLGQGRLSVLDFGGSLGSSYFQCRGFLSGLKNLRWSVVEQPKHVACGRQDFQDDQLRFYYTVDECLTAEQPDVILFSGVLQFLPEPYAFMREVAGKGIRHVIIDRTGFVRGERDYIAVENVPEWVYPARYAAWFFVEEKVLRAFQPPYRLVSDFIGSDSGVYPLEGAEAYFKGFIFDLAPPGSVAALPRGERPVLVNVGCGGRIHPDWVNIDIESTRPGVIAHDISRSLPMETGSCDAVYHSAVLEHIRPQDAGRLLAECHRVLKPGGILRIGVPDLETIARLYLEKLDQAAAGSTEAEADYDWMLLELLDQAVRERSGGQMLHYLAQQPMPNEAFVKERIGVEGEEIVETIRRSPEVMASKPEPATPDERALAIGKFRLGGEVHQWMYDRFSLARLLRRTGFEDIRQVNQRESRIAGWETYHLEVTADGRLIKPDLLVMEAVRPANPAE